MARGHSDAIASRRAKYGPAAGHPSDSDQGRAHACPLASVPTGLVAFPLIWEKAVLGLIPTALSNSHASVARPRGGRRARLAVPRLHRDGSRYSTSQTHIGGSYPLDFDRLSLHDTSPGQSWTHQVRAGFWKSNRYPLLQQRKYSAHDFTTLLFPIKRIYITLSSLDDSCSSLPAPPYAFVVYSSIYKFFKHLFDTSSELLSSSEPFIHLRQLCKHSLLSQPCA